ncbi:MAG: lysophospholipase [Oscillospiraceae bacterium]|jgi:pimeloyl-ACP methyl ester carboxylesterase|nr:lysophospholipase [Oscillospiraceae bacterium]
MNPLRRALSALLALSLLCACVTVSRAAPAADNTPIIILPGYTADQLFLRPDADDREVVWDLDFSAVGTEILRELPRLFFGLVQWTLTGRDALFVEGFRRAAARVLGIFAVNPDGTSAQPVGPYPTRAADCSAAALRDQPYAGLIRNGSFVRKFEQQVGADRVFVLQFDWRAPAGESTRQLRTFIQEVKALTGSDTVRLFGSSYGGLLAGVYLYEYAEEGDVSRAVLEFPALGGTSMVPPLLTGEEFALNTETLTRFVQSYMGTELELDPLTRWLCLDFLSGLATDLLQTALLPVVKTWGSLWDLVPAASYDRVKAKVLAPGEHYAWETDSDRLHHVIMPGMGAALRAAEAAGTEIRIVANTGSLHLLGTDGVNSDGLLDVALTTGAAALPLGKHGLSPLPDPVCADNSHRHLSPGQDIDAAQAYLPESTWFVQGQFHGMSPADPYAFALTADLMLRPELRTVWDDPAYPQFGLCRQPSENIAVALGPENGWIPAAGAALRIDNLSAKYDLQLLRVCAEGTGLIFQVDTSRRAGPGESLSVPLAGALNAAPGAYIPLKVTYLQYTEGVPVIKTKIFDATAPS